jgi:nucleotide-binding universal stress UspA family protein
MDVAVALAIWAAVVVVTMLAIAYVSPRWGHDPFGWLLLSAVLGPLALVALYGTHQSDVQRPHTYAAPAPPGGRRPVLLAVDGSDASARAASYAAQAFPGGSMLLLTVLPREERDRESEAEHAERVERLAGPARRILREAGVAHEVVVGYGSPAEEILRCAAETDVSAIVVGKRGAGLTKALLGSVSDHVVKHADRAVVTVD